MRVHQRVGGLQPGRSVFDLSYEKKFTCDMGELIPIMCDEVVPGDVLAIGNEIVIRFQPMVAPILHEVNVYVHYFFVPNRILWDDWEDFITGGSDGTLAPTLPTWNVSSNGVGSLWDYLGFPTSVTPTGALPVDFPRRAYNRIYNEFYRDQTLITEVAATNETILLRAWEKDYFTSALPWQQRGTAPALPISGVLSVDAKDEAILVHNTNDATDRTMAHAVTTGDIYTGSAPSATGNARWGATTGLEVDLSGGTTFDISDLRLAFQIQKWLERNARAGARYTEFLRSHFGIAPRDDRLDRPEYIGGSKMPVIVSEVLQTGETGTTPQGNMAGHAIAVDRRFVSKYRVNEFGLIMGIMSVMPRTAYSQGVDRQWLKSTKYDYYFPEFANLSEQAVIRAELYANGVSGDNNTVFGYQGRFDELRVKSSKIAGDLRSTYDYWHLGRQFGSAPALNQTFIECVPRKDIFAAPSVDGLIVSFGNRIKAIRPLPIMSNPGMIDHM